MSPSFWATGDIREKMSFLGKMLEWMYGNFSWATPLTFLRVLQGFFSECITTPFDFLFKADSKKGLFANDKDFKEFFEVSVREVSSTLLSSRK